MDTKLNKYKAEEQYINSQIDKQECTMYYSTIKRLFDFVCAFMACIILSPLLVGTAIAIYCEDKGTVFFTQTRIGKDEKPFKIYKFRSMVMEADKIHEELRAQSENTEVSFKLKKDPRMTKVGKFIRKYNIDELPQLINVLRGDMSMVGPRPLPDYEYEETKRRYGSLYQKRYSVPQGLTCYWQISERASCTYEKRMEMDLEYAEKANVREDLILIIKTAVYTVLGKAEY